MAGSSCTYVDQLGNYKYKICYAGCCETDCCSFDTPDHKGLPSIALYGLGIGGGMILLVLVSICCGMARKKANQRTSTDAQQPTELEDNYTRIARRYDNPFVNNPFRTGYAQHGTQVAGQNNSESNNEGSTEHAPISFIDVSQPMSLLKKKSSGPNKKKDSADRDEVPSDVPTMQNTFLALV